MSIPVPSEVVWSGHGRPMRIPVYPIPGMRHLIELEVVTEHGDPVDLTGTTHSAAMYDAMSGAVMYVYDVALDEHLLTFTAPDTATIALDHNSAYEWRWVRDSPGPDMLAAGPAIFVETTVPQEA